MTVIAALHTLVGKREHFYRLLERPSKRLGKGSIHPAQLREYAVIEYANPQRVDVAAVYR